MGKINANILLVGGKDFNIKVPILSAFQRKGVDINIIKMTLQETEQKQLFNVVKNNIICIFVEESFDWLFAHRKMIRKENIPIISVLFKTENAEVYYQAGATAVISTMAWTYFYDEVEHIIDGCLYSATYNYCKKNEIPMAQYTFENTKYNPKTHTLTVCGTETKLTNIEWYIMEFFMLNLNKVIPFKEILRYGWYHANHYTRRSFDVYLTRLRKYLKEDPTLSLVTYEGNGIALEYKQ